MKRYRVPFLLAMVLFFTGLLASAALAGTDTWTARASGTEHRLNGVTHTGDQFVAVGDGGTILSSADGVKWEVRPVQECILLFGFNCQPLATNLSGVAYGGNQFVAVGEGGKILSSADSVTWTPRVSNTSENLNGITYGGGQFVAVGSGGMILSSTDGVTWVARRSTPVGFGPFATTETLSGVAYGGGRFVAVGRTGNMMSSSGLVLTSDDGVTWTTATLPAPLVPVTLEDLNGVGYGRGQFVAMGYWERSWSSGSDIFTSADGAEWTARTSGTTSVLRGITYGGGQFVAVGEGGTILTSTDGAEWTARTSGITNPLRAAAYGGGRFTAVGDGGTILTADTGLLDLMPIDFPGGIPGAEVRDTTPPVWPGSWVRATHIRPTELTLTWMPARDDVGVTRYRIYQGDTLIRTIFAVTTYVVTGLTPGTSYTFKVEAGDEAGNWSTDGPRTTVPTPLAPADSFNLQAQPRGSRIELRWTAPAVPGAAVPVGYNVFRSASPDQVTFGAGTRLNDFPLTETTYLDDGMEMDTVSYYAVQAMYEGYSGPMSREVSARATRTSIVLTVGSTRATVNDAPQDLPVAPRIVNGRTFVPLRFIGEAMGADIGWDGAERRVTYRLPPTTIDLWIDQTRARVNGADVTLDVAPFIVGASTVVPVRFVAERLGAQVDWDAATQRVIITFPPSGS